MEDKVEEGNDQGWWEEIDCRNSLAWYLLDDEGWNYTYKYPSDYIRCLDEHRLSRSAGAGFVRKTSVCCVTVI